MKHLTTIEVSTKPLVSFWMKNAYRVPAGLFPVDHPFKSQATEVSVPITAPIDDETAAEIIAYLASNYAVTKKP
jgi:hypothetical protein